jgi:hypothetical protein
MDDLLWDEPHCPFCVFSLVESMEHRHLWPRLSRRGQGLQEQFHEEAFSCRKA